MIKLGINIDHVATLRQARGGFEPDPLLAAKICENAGCDSIVAHLREDRRHIEDSDIIALRKSIRTKLNLEMSIAPDIVKFACEVCPDQATLVPERRLELTTEGGLDVKKGFSRIKKAVEILQNKGIVVSLFVDPEKLQIEYSKKTGAEFIELHTGLYANADSEIMRKKELEKLSIITKYARSLGLGVNAGHGLNYFNAKDVARINGIEELNIGHSIIARAVFTGLGKAVGEMIEYIR